MKAGINRRYFLKQSALAAGALGATGLLPRRTYAATKGGTKLNCVQIGCGGRGRSHLDAVIVKNAQNLYALVEPDVKQHAAVKKILETKGIDTGSLQLFTDYRVMFDKIGKNVDAVFIAAPNHHHAPAAMMAMQRGINVYCEKPVCHDIAEARLMRDMARKYPKVATQMGNQGHCMEEYRRLCEYIWSGTIGKVTETHSWTDRANGGEGPRPPVIAPPAGMDWDLWLGPAPFREYHADIHPHEWHGWYDFGNGSIGNMGCHVLDGVFWALKVEHPTSVEVEYIRGGSDERYPIGSRIRWDVPARGDMPPLKSYWYEGMNPTTTAKPQGNLHAARGDARNFPPLLLELRKQYPDEELDKMDSGTLYVGDKGVIYTGTYGDRMHIVPYEKMNATPKPAKTLPRPKDIFTDFVQACLAGHADTAVGFEYGTRLTEFAILGNLAQHAGQGKKLVWDGPNMKVTSHPELNAWVQRPYRKGWEV